MIDPATERRLHDIIRREGRSFLQYVSEVDPFTDSRTASAWPVILELAKQERAGVQELITLLRKNHRSIPKLDSYPILFTTVNFASLEYLLPRLIRDLDERRAALEKLAQEQDEGPVRFHLRGLVETKARQIETLRHLNAG